VGENGVMFFTGKSVTGLYVASPARLKPSSLRAFHSYPCRKWCLIYNYGFELKKRQEFSRLTLSILITLN